MELPVVAYSGLELRALIVELPVALGELPTPEWLTAWLQPGAHAPMQASEGVRTAVRDLLRQRGYRPTGRGKPAAEYLANAAAEGRLGAINPAVDCGNAASLHSGMPISVVDLERTVPPLRVEVPAAGTTYVFNASGQAIDVEGLLSLCDAQGPCANAVKDAQRTKTSAATRRVLAIVWGTQAPEPGRAGLTAAWLRELFERLGAHCAEVTITPAS